MPVRHDPRTGKFMGLGGARGFKASVKGGGLKNPAKGIGKPKQFSQRDRKNVADAKAWLAERTARTLPHLHPGALFDLRMAEQAHLTRIVRGH